LNPLEFAGEVILVSASGVLSPGPLFFINYVTVQMNNLTTNYTPDQYLNSLMLGDAADYKNFPDIRFIQNTTNNIVIAGHLGYLLNGTFRDPTSDALQRFTTQFQKFRLH
jgi:hypothetical protein